MEEGLVHEGVALETLGDPAKTIEPSKAAFDHPTVAGKFPVGTRTVFEFPVIRARRNGML
jgi:hypothetical protein